MEPAPALGSASVGYEKSPTITALLNSDGSLDWGFYNYIIKDLSNMAVNEFIINYLSLFYLKERVYKDRLPSRLDWSLLFEVL